MTSPLVLLISTWLVTVPKFDQTLASNLSRALMMAVDKENKTTHMRISVPCSTVPPPSRRLLLKRFMGAWRRIIPAMYKVNASCFLRGIDSVKPQTIDSTKRDAHQRDSEKFT